MKDTWEILKNELSLYGFSLKDDDTVAVANNSGETSIEITDAISNLSKQIKDNKELFREAWKHVRDICFGQCVIDNKDQIIDDNLKKLFIFSIKDLYRLLEIISEVDNSSYHEALDHALSNDINDFTVEQMHRICDMKISIDWITRLINRLIYIRKMLIFAKKGFKDVQNYQIKEAKGISGPWSRLELPIRERVWPWQEEEENIRGRDYDIRHQRRYEKGFRNYNNDGSVGEGHYWRELRNEPFRWQDKGDESPYSHRSVLSNWP